LFEAYLSHHVLVGLFKSQQRETTWDRLVKKIFDCHESCKTTFDVCNIEIEQISLIKKWISDYHPEVAHNDNLERTGVDRKYRDCGQWLLNSQEFTFWVPKEPLSDNRVLWIRGTGWLYLHILYHKLIINSWYRKINIVVGVFSSRCG
jgi:hypothetical protein